MYSRKAQGWLKHLDFILLDMLCLQVAYFLAYVTRHGWGSPYASSDYLNLAGIYLLVDFLVLIANRSMKNVLKRGLYKEISQTVKHVFLVMLIVSLYMFSIQRGSTYSRIMFYLLAIYYVVITYFVRLYWKRFLLKRKKGMIGGAMYFVTTADRAQFVVERFRKNAIVNRKIQGICIIDADWTGQTVADVPATRWISFLTF